ncbi:hypothetical protein BRC96_04475 [Halobacteriales archaeon QS_6_64_34]|nr:MAG: hypothetical protein BRC96_04475 [Halobacteriales archaeon QS_6_64_34]
MSDFDKEAEREKLREKYGEEEEKREATEQMSELLLKGATMTNAHCTTCGDPIFRYDGQEFCPTCQKPVARDQPDEEADDETGDHIEVADPSDDATVQFGAEATADQDTAGRQATDAAGHSPAAEGDATQTSPSVDPDRTPDPTAGAPSSPPTGSDASASTDAVANTPDASASTPDSHAPRERRSQPDNSVTAELSAAESLLAETVHRFAQRAADTDDPRTACEQLKAAREAAETLDAVRF